MPRTLLIALLALVLAPCWTVVAAGDALDSKAWGKVSTTTGPARPGAIEAQRAKLAELEAIARGLKPLPPGPRGVNAPSPAVVASEARPHSVSTSRPYTGAELAACEARIRAKLGASAHPAPAPPSLVWPGLLPPKPREPSTSVPLEGEALARSLALERDRAAAPPRAPRVTLAPRVAPAPHITPHGIAKTKPPVMRTEIPGTPMNDEQRAKLERARAAERRGAVTRPPQDRR